MSTYAYATIAMLREYLPQVKEAAASDSLLRRVLARARGIIDSELKFAFFDVDVDSGAVTAWGSAAARIIDPVPTDHWVKLPSYKAGSVTSITYLDDTGATQTLTDYVEDWNGGRFCLYRAADTSTTPPTTTQLWVNGPYTVTAIWGFGPPPLEIEEMNLELAVNLWRAREKGSFAELSGPTGGAIKAVGALSKEQKEVIANVNRLYYDWIEWGRV